MISCFVLFLRKEISAFTLPLRRIQTSLRHYIPGWSTWFKEVSEASGRGVGCRLGLIFAGGFGEEEGIGIAVGVELGSTF